MLFLAEAQMARQNPILFTKSARLLTKLNAWADTAPLQISKELAERVHTPTDRDDEARGPE